jgi:hypothetical protein
VRFTPLSEPKESLPARRPYEKPVLHRLGSVRDITMANSPPGKTRAGPDAHNDRRGGG